MLIFPYNFDAKILVSKCKIYAHVHTCVITYIEITNVLQVINKEKKSTCKNLIMLLAPKTRWAIVNFAGSVGGKYGAKTHFSAHLRRSILQAAQGLSTTVCWGERGGGGGKEVGEGELMGVVVSFTVATATAEAVGVAAEVPPLISIFSMILDFLGTKLIIYFILG